MKHKNYYEILEVSQTASYNEIKRSYYSLCKRYHPDINPKTANLFKQINEAYDILMNPIARREYDESLKEEASEKTQTTSQQESYENTTHDSYYTDAQYYQDPSKEPIFDVLKEANKYRFENVIKAIWHRNIFVLFGHIIISFIIIMMTLFERIAKMFKKSIRPIRVSKYYWIRLIWQSVKSNHFITYIWWSIFLNIIFASKCIYIVFKTIMFIYTRILRPLLLPLAIILASIIHSGRIERRYH